MYITIICAKIFYGNTQQDVDNHIATYMSGTNKRSTAVSQYIQAVQTHNTSQYQIINKKYVSMSDDQFVRFKNAGRRHPSNHPGKLAGSASRTRQNRTRDSALQKWDVEPYSSLTGKSGPWGNGSLTNRDHMLANSSLQQQNAAQHANVRLSSSAVKRGGLAITVSGKHHRMASYTYGGRTKSPSPVLGLNRTQYGADHPVSAFMVEMDSMLAWKFSHQGTHGVQKNTLRLEMVGAYVYMYKKSVDLCFIEANIAQDLKLLDWVEKAVANDDRKIRV